ncbi:MAG TPA: nucleotidyltransferase family protein [Casimicrobiaceae bacterium]|nr:nucleotidyltransferase family protein [Casimicrobiaceae bacterium]
MIPVTGLLLAAGRAMRFGGHKLLAQLPNGTPVGIASLRNLQQALGSVIVVVRGEDIQFADRCRNEGATVIVAERAEEGMGASLAAGVAAVNEASGVIVALADMPWIEPATIKRVAEAIGRGASIAAPVYQGRRGHPVAFARSHRQALLALSGDDGARSIVAANAAAVRSIEVLDRGVVRDVDTSSDLDSA